MTGTTALLKSMSAAPITNSSSIADQRSLASAAASEHQSSSIRPMGTCLRSRLRRGDVWPMPTIMPKSILLTAHRIDHSPNVVCSGPPSRPCSQRHTTALIKLFKRRLT